MRFQHRGHTAVVALREHGPIGVLALADQIRADAPRAATAVTALTDSTPVLLTGDNAATTRRLAEQVAITNVHNGLLPQDKVTAVGELDAAGQRMAMAGDGINDAVGAEKLYLCYSGGTVVFVKDAAESILSSDGDVIQSV